MHCTQDMYSIPVGVYSALVCTVCTLVVTESGSTCCFNYCTNFIDTVLVAIFIVLLAVMDAD